MSDVFVTPYGVAYVQISTPMRSPFSSMRWLGSQRRRRWCLQIVRPPFRLPDEPEYQRLRQDDCTAQEYRGQVTAWPGRIIGPTDTTTGPMAQTSQQRPRVRKRNRATAKILLA